MQDTTSSAMTEVALGLSMAFFTLLIVALLSLSVPKRSEVKTLNKVTSTRTNDLKNNETVAIKMTKQAKADTPPKDSPLQFVFYFKKKFYDETLTERSITSFAQDQTLIIAVDPTLTFAEVFSLKLKIKHPDFSLTVSSEAWRLRLQQLKILG